jgi:hypothetical protein
LFAAVVHTEVGNGNNTLFWTDSWLQGNSVSRLAPLVFANVSPRIRKKRTVAEALENNRWVADIQISLSWAGLNEFLLVWDYVQEVELTDLEDHHI